MSLECLECLECTAEKDGAHLRFLCYQGRIKFERRSLCTRGPIERELRAWVFSLNLHGLSGAAVRIIDGVYHQHIEWAWQRDHYDILSEAIEAAAELGL